MSSDLFEFDESIFPDSFSPFNNPSSPLDVLQAFSENHHSIPQGSVDETTSFIQIAPGLLPSSPPSYQFENLSLCQPTHLQNVSDSAHPFADSYALEVKTQHCDYQSFGPQNFGGAETAVTLMQKCYISSSFDGKSGFLFQPAFESLMESLNFQPEPMSSPQNSFANGQMRRVYSTGDIQMKTTLTNHGMSSSPLVTQSSFTEEANFKVGRYSAEERKERIHRYRAKRTQRNFNKTIKYACRKTLADNRPRIRGRFARNDENGEITKAATLHQFEEDDEFWIDGFNEEGNEVRVGGTFFDSSMGGGLYFNNLDLTQFQYRSY